MKFVFFGYDVMVPVAESLIRAGHECVAIFSFPCDQVFNFNHNCQALGKAVGASYIESPVTDMHIDSLIGQGADLFIAAGYPHKIPDIDEGRAYGLNIHPSYLPYARGLMPAPYVLMNGLHEAAGCSVHKMTREYDAGDILAQFAVDLGVRENVETYTAKILTRMTGLIVDLVNDLPNVWVNATPQDGTRATLAPKPDDAMRMLDWTQGVDQILRVADAFGGYGCLAKIDDALLYVFACDGWLQDHEYPLGTCITLQNNMAVIAVADGFIALKRFERASE